jgi:hypothetical protein
MSCALPHSCSLLGLLCCVGLLSCGCNASPEHEEHAHHEIPEHRPRDFPHAALRIRHRFNQFSKLLEIRDDELVIRKFNELQDIVRWLPELAGESDLPEAEWNEVQNISRSLQTKLAPLGNQLDKLSVDAWKRFSSEQESLLTQLDKLSQHKTFQNENREIKP